ncbi:MAG TPA: GNAT family N-acetyltransferase [Actinomycetota bacterium]
MELRNLSMHDLWLYEAIHCDPGMMEHLGGPLPREGLPEKLERDVATTEAGETWVLVIVPDEDPGAAAGTVAIWDHEWEGRTITEIGWMVLPAFQGRGLGSGAVREALRRVRSAGRWEVVHAFPPVANVRSNAMCRALGFTVLGEGEFRFRDRVLRCNHWELDLRKTGPA